MLKYKFSNHFAWEESEWTTRIIGEENERKCKLEQGRGNVYIY